MTIPATRTAVVATEQRTATLTTLPIIPPGPGELLVQVHYVALNPVDWKLLGRSTPANGVLAKDYSGVVLTAGEGTNFKPGDRVAGLAMGGLGNPLSAGGATTHATVEADLAWHVPDDFKLADAPTFGIAGSTAAFALYYILGVPFPPHQEEGWLAISGGSTQVGLFFIQYAKLSGFKVVATSSEKNFGLLKEYGADEVVDYHDPEAVEKIRSFKPRFVAELAGGSSWDLSGAIGGERYVAVLENPESKSEYVGYGRVFKPSATFDPKVRKWAAELYEKRIPELIRAGVRPAPITVRKGLELVPQGLEDLKNGKTSGTKFVFQVVESPA